jgi:insertion element IS1 protein InsB
VKRLYEKIKHCKQAIFYTDDWDAFAKVLPAERHVIGNQHTVAIERNNSNTRHYQGRFKRRTKIVSKCEEAVNRAIHLWWFLCENGAFTILADTFRSLLI